MPDYKKMYTLLFNGITDALESIQKADWHQAKKQLVSAQEKAEELYIGASEESSEAE